MTGEGGELCPPKGGRYTETSVVALIVLRDTDALTNF